MPAGKGAGFGLDIIAFCLFCECEMPVYSMTGYANSLAQPPKAEDGSPTPDPVIELYKRDVDRTLLREHLKLTPQQRIEKLLAFMRSAERLREATTSHR